MKEAPASSRDPNVEPRGRASERLTGRQDAHVGLVSPVVDRVVENLSEALDPGMGGEGKALHPDVQRRGHALSPQQDVSGQGPGQTIQVSAMVVAAGGPHRFEGPAEPALLYDQRRRLDGSPPPAIHEQEYTGKAEHPETDIQKDEDNECLDGHVPSCINVELRLGKARKTVEYLPRMNLPKARWRRPESVESQVLAVEA